MRDNIYRIYLPDSKCLSFRNEDRTLLLTSQVLFHIYTSLLRIVSYIIAVKST